MEPIIIQIYKHPSGETYPVPEHCGRALKFGYPGSNCETCGASFSTDDITNVVFSAMGLPAPSKEENELCAAKVIKATRK